MPVKRGTSEHELEIRGKFKNEKDLKEAILKAGGLFRLNSHRHRFAILFTNRYNKGLDLQIRFINEVPEVVLKVGRHSGTEREEFRYKIAKESFESTVDVFYHIGFNSAVVAEAEEWIFELDKEREFKIVNCDEKIFCWEIESSRSGEAKENLEKLARSLALVPLSESQIRGYWRWMKKYANRKFDIKLYVKWYKDYLKKLNEEKITSSVSVGS